MCAPTNVKQTKESFDNHVKETSVCKSSCLGS